MSILLFISTIILNVAAIAFAGIYIWLNAFSGFRDLGPRNASVLNTTKISMALSMVSALLSCLFTKTSAVQKAIDRATHLYTIIAVSWLVVLLACGVALAYLLVSKKTFSSEKTKSVKKIFVIALCGAVIAVVLSWLFS